MFAPYFQRFSKAGVTDALLDLLMRQQGYNITVIDAFTFSVNIDMTATPPPYDANWTIMLTSKQFIMNIEFMYVRAAPEGRISGEDCGNVPA